MPARPRIAATLVASLLLTYVHSDVLERPDAFAGSRPLHATLERVGERFTFGMDRS